MKPREILDKTIRFAAGALREPTGDPSSRRVVMVAAIFAAIFFAAGLLIKHPDMTVDLTKFVITNAVAVYGLTKVSEIAKG